MKEVELMLAKINAMHSLLLQKQKMESSGGSGQAFVVVQQKKN